MARTIDQITQTMKDQYVLLRAQYGLVYDNPDLWSNANIKRLFVGVMAYCHWLLEMLFDTLQSDNLAALATQKPGVQAWYVDKAKDFQYGFPLVGRTEYFDNTGYSEGEIEDSKIVDYAALTEQEDPVSKRVFLRLKLAHDNGLDLEQLTPDQIAGVKDWFKRVKHAGVKMEFDSLPPDSIVQSWTIYYDPLILSGTGSRLDGQAMTPVQDAIKGYLKNLPFNGLYAPQYHTDAVQAVPGVVLCELGLCQVRYGSLPYQPVYSLYTPDAGYLRFLDEADLQIQFIAQTAIK